MAGERGWNFFILRRCQRRPEDPMRATPIVGGQAPPAERQFGVRAAGESAGLAALIHTSDAP